MVAFQNNLPAWQIDEERSGPADGPFEVFKHMGVSMLGEASQNAA